MHCKECGKEAKMIDDTLIRGCDCKAPVIIDMNAQVTGEGGLST